MSDNALRDVVERFLSWVEDDAGCMFNDASRWDRVHEWAREMRNVLPTHHIWRSTFTHREDFDHCEVPEACRMYGSRLTRYVEYDPPTGQGAVYYADQHGKPTTYKPLIFTGLKHYIDYCRLWRRCMVQTDEWPEGFDGSTAPALSGS